VPAKALLLFSSCHKERLLDKKKILVIEDSADTRMLEKIALEYEGFEVFTASDGLAALKLIPQLPKLDLILVDVQMEGMSGTEFIERLETDYQNIYENTPIAFVTGLAEPPPIKVTGFIRKVSDLDDFIGKVKSFIR
jgi:CheY-like chemotaxis protein